jgi:hypothetical protein
VNKVLALATLGDTTQLEMIYNSRFVDSRSGLFIICSCDHLKHCNSQGSMDVSILPEVSKDGKLKVWFFQTLEVCDLTKRLVPKWCFVVETKWPPGGFIGGSQDWSLEPGNTKGGSITVPLTSCLTGLDSAV